MTSQARDDELSLEEIERLMRCRWLAGRAAFWAEIASLCGITEPAHNPDPGLQSFQNKSYGPLQTVSALWHLQRCLENLQSLDYPFEGNFATAARRILAEFKKQDIVGARDALEHIEDRVSHVNMEKYASKKHHSPSAEFLTQFSSANGILNEVTVLGRTFYVGQAVLLAIGLEPVLFAEAEKLTNRLDDVFANLSWDAGDDNVG
jgi:hypothetical protein